MSIFNAYSTQGALPADYYYYYYYYYYCGLCGAIYSCSNGNVEKHICGFKCMTIRPLHLEINSEVFFTLIFAVLYFKSNARHTFGVHSTSDAPSIKRRLRRFLSRAPHFLALHFLLPSPPYTLDAYSACAHCQQSWWRRHGDVDIMTSWCRHDIARRLAERLRFQNGHQVRISRAKKQI